MTMAVKNGFDIQRASVVEAEVDMADAEDGHHFFSSV